MQGLAEAGTALIEPTVVVPAGRSGFLQVRPPAGREEARSSFDWEVRVELEGGGSWTGRGRSRRGRGGEAKVPLGRQLPSGYHRVVLEVFDRSNGSGKVRQTRIVAPQTCPGPDVHPNPSFGVMANLYTMRSRANWGFGDFGDLRALSAWVAEQGGAFIGLNPLCALDVNDPSGSPYSPSSRLFGSPSYLEIERIPEFREAGRRILSRATEREIEEQRSAGAIDYSRVWRTKLGVLEKLHRVFTRRTRSSRRSLEYDRFRRERGESLESFATFCALQEMLVGRRKGSADWRNWPRAFRDRGSGAVASFRREAAARIDFFRYLQFEIDRQLRLAGRHARKHGAAIGFMLDLPLGAAPGGADTWAARDVFVDGVDIGAPPDALGPDGQNWAFPPMNPRRLKASGYAEWTQLLRASLRHAGALRLDHVMGLFRQFWIPAGRPAAEGAYVTFPSADLLAILALESRRAGAMVVGEDLGTVPPEVRPELARREILSTRVLYFERHDGGIYRTSRSYPRRCLAAANTHDLIPLAGFWQGRDVQLRNPGGEGRRTEEGMGARAKERRLLVTRLRAEKVLSTRTDPDIWSPSLCGSVHDLLHQSDARLVALSLDDLVGELDPVNLPGVGPEGYASWKRRMTRSLEEIRVDAAVREAIGSKSRTRSNRRRRPAARGSSR